MKRGLVGAGSGQMDGQPHTAVLPLLQAPFVHVAQVPPLDPIPRHFTTADLGRTQWQEAQIAQFQFDL